MKKIIFLITLIVLALLLIKPTEAKTTRFYEDEFISNVWMNKKNPKDGLTYYNQARFFREITTNNIAYCIEPFIFFDGNQTYQGTTSPINYTQEQITEMTLIAHFGYGYKNHTEPKWYAVTQFMLWKVAEPNAYYYFSSYKNGPEVSMFEQEISEINNLVNAYKKTTSFNNTTYDIVEGESLTLTDTNNTLNSFKTTSAIATIKNNTLTTKQLSEGTYKITLQKESNIYNRPILFYQSPTNQDIIDLGDPIPLTNEITINVIKTNIKITKIDAETLKRAPQGDAKLIGTIFDLYNGDDEYVKSITIGEDYTATITNLPFGTYYVREKTPGEGYNKTLGIFYVSVSKENPNRTFHIPNKVIKAKLKIKKEYGYQGNFKPEVNISFNIYNKNNELIKTIITDNNGYTEITLPYGKYKLTQLTTTEGYKKIEPIYFEITSEKDILYELKDYKITVPDTQTKSFFQQILNYLKELLCGKK